MGREVKRVSMEFNWPIGKVWTGYRLDRCVDDCDSCREFARIQGLALTDYGCPILPYREPPSGDGWQMWETTSEGSPISPVMVSPEALAEWLSDNKASAFGDQTATYDAWLRMINSGYAPSAVSCDGEIISGVAFVSRQDQ